VVMSRSIAESLGMQAVGAIFPLVPASSDQRGRRLGSRR